MSSNLSLSVTPPASYPSLKLQHVAFLGYGNALSTADFFYDFLEIVEVMCEAA